MKRALLLLSLLVAFVTGAVCQEPEASVGPTRFPMYSHRYTVEGDGFSVLLPSRPAFTTSKVARKDGQERTKHLLTLTKFDVVYSIEVFENLKPAQPLDELIAESNAGVPHDPTTERNLTVNGFAGKEYSSQTRTTTTVVQFFATADRLFRFAATGPVAAAPLIKDFFSSIEFGGETAAIDVSDLVYIGRDVDVKARFLEIPEPSYTKDARDNKVEGKVILKTVFAKTGRVENIVVVQGLPYGLTERAITAARQIKFVPATKDGKAVSMWMQLEYNFSL